MTPLKQRLHRELNTPWCLFWFDLPEIVTWRLLWWTKASLHVFASSHLLVAFHWSLGGNHDVGVYELAQRVKLYSVPFVFDGATWRVFPRWLWYSLVLCLVWTMAPTIFHRKCVICCSHHCACVFVWCLKLWFPHVIYLIYLSSLCSNWAHERMSFFCVLPPSMIHKRSFLNVDLHCCRVSPRWKSTDGFWSRSILDTWWVGVKLGKFRDSHWPQLGDWSVISFFFGAKNRGASPVFGGGKPHRRNTRPFRKSAFRWDFWTWRI